MEIVAISCIKNEGDIIETFVRVNSTFVDTFIFVDDSTDATGTILQKLAAEGFNIIRLFRQDQKEPYQQDLVMMGALQFALSNNVPGDFFLLLDSDEFPEFASKDEAVKTLALIPTGFVGSYKWRTYVPESLEFSSLKKNALQSIFRERLPEGVEFEKIIIPRALICKLKIFVGSHGALRTDGKPLKTLSLQSKLAHFPVRSPLQITKKNISAVYWLMRKKTRLPDEGFHVFETLSQLMQLDFQISLESLQKLAVSYASDQSSCVMLGDRPNWVPEYELIYQGLDERQAVSDIAKMLVESWSNSFSAEQTHDLLRALKSVKKTTSS